jgi:hypothetical protein
MQGPAVWLPAHLVEPGSVHASKSAVPSGPGLLDATVFSPNDTISEYQVLLMYFKDV